MLITARRSTATLTGAALLLTGAVSAVGLGAGAASAAPRTTALAVIADLSAQRVEVADQVAAAKYGTGSPIDDPAREAIVIADAEQQATALGIDPAAVGRIFRDQIEASKVVQRALFAEWDADPSLVPTTKPSLATIRAELNTIDAELVQAIATAQPGIHAPSCGGLLTAATVHARHAQGLDTLHFAALLRSLPSVCAD
ncbi:chorismate mutase [Streptacidiphilus jiangxiensis]|uniref:chorismate mutase n=1 Tax=Streptacidiphilus jiangxiensis TaxID=235985 RepID=A0A1H8APK2_STRJI|nr:chorismate mutase [Streptacidiphilus jiangxiensis]SEM71709.1 chorismate mutase [Streptacidiphilus jiangxiensis]